MAASHGVHHSCIEIDTVELFIIETTYHCAVCSWQPILTSNQREVKQKEVVPEEVDNKKKSHKKKKVTASG